jgi:hypothetical protein
MAESHDHLVSSCAVCQGRVRSGMVLQLEDPQARKDRLAWVLDPRYGLPAVGKTPMTPEEVLADIQRQVRNENRGTWR